MADDSKRPTANKGPEPPVTDSAPSLAPGPVVAPEPTVIDHSAPAPEANTPSAESAPDASTTATAPAEGAEIPAPVSVARIRAAIDPPAEPEPEPEPKSFDCHYCLAVLPNRTELKTHEENFHPAKGKAREDREARLAARRRGSRR